MGECHHIVEEIEKSNAHAVWGMFLALAKEQNAEQYISADEERLRRSLSGSDSILRGFLAKENGNYIGMVLYYFGFSPYSAAPFLYFKCLYVDPDHRKKDVAKSLMRKLCEVAKEKECSYVTWDVLTDNKNAAAYYEHLGFKPDSEPLLNYAEILDNFEKGLNG